MESSTLTKICTVKAPAKAILCGEHAVVYGQDAIAMGISLYCTGVVFKQKKQQKEASLNIALNIDPQKIAVSSEALDLFQELFSNDNQTCQFELYEKSWTEKIKYENEKSAFDKSIHFKLGIFLKKIKKCWAEWASETSEDYFIEITSEIPLGKCLGSSAAFNTVLTTAFLVIFSSNQFFPEFQLRNDTREVINEISVLFERVQHGNPSGIDNFVSVYGGLILFNKLKEPKFKSLSKDAHKFRERFDVAIADSGIQKNTKKAVEMVRERCKQNEQDQEKISLIGKISQRILILLEREQIDTHEVLELIKKNHLLLKDFGLSHQQLERLLQVGQGHGWTGKITGSGMGGCLLLIAESKTWRSNKQIVLAQLDETGLTVSFDDKQ